MGKKRFNCATLPAELRAKQNAKWEVPGAIAELVDNSFGRGRGNASMTTIYYDAKARTLSVMDNGVGMNHIGDLFQGGKGAGRHVGDIGEYGAGGTLAILWLASRVEIWTLRAGEVMHDAVTWSHWFRAPSFENLDVSDEWERASFFNTPSELTEAKHGTFIRMHLLTGRLVRPSAVIRRLSEMYSPGLRNHKRLDWVTMRKGEVIGEPQTLVDAYMAPSKDAENVSIDIIIEYGEHSLPVRGKVYYDENTPVSHSKIQIGYGHRVIYSTKDCYNSPDGEERYSGTGVSGWLDLNDEWKEFLTVTKDDINLEELKRTLMGYVFEEIKKLLKKSDSSSLTLYIEDLLIGFQAALNAKPGTLEAELAAKAKKGRQPPEIKIVKHGDPGPEEWPEPKSDETDETGKTRRKIPPAFALELKKTSDKQMGGHLCSAEVSELKIVVYINEDHVAVQEAMKAKPINKLALHLLTLGELASCVADNEKCQQIVKSWFPPESIRSLEDIQPGRDTARMIERWLIDRVRNPIPIDDEDEAA